jgi:hypothetical protein
MTNTAQGPVREPNRYYWGSISVMYSVHDRYLTSCIKTLLESMTVYLYWASQALLAPKRLWRNAKGDKYRETAPLRFATGTGGSAKPFSSRL